MWTPNSQQAMLGNSWLKLVLFTRLFSIVKTWFEFPLHRSIRLDLNVLELVIPHGFGDFLFVSYKIPSYRHPPPWYWCSVFYLPSPEDIWRENWINTYSYIVFTISSTLVSFLKFYVPIWQHFLVFCQWSPLISIYLKMFLSLLFFKMLYSRNNLSSISAHISMYSLMHFCVGIFSCSYHMKTYEDENISATPKLPQHLLVVNSFPYTPCLVVTSLFSVSIVLPFPKLCINRLIEYVLFQVWLFSLGPMHLRFIQVIACISSLFLFIAE